MSRSRPRPRSAPGRTTEPPLLRDPVRVLVLLCPQWPLQVAALSHDLLPEQPVAIIDRGVVHTCSPAAEAEGVTVGLRLRQAQQRCANLIVIPHDPDRQRRHFMPIQEALTTVVPQIQVVRPGLAAAPAAGASRFHGGDEELAERIFAEVVDLVHDPRLAIADGLFAAEQAALRTTAESPLRLLPPEESAAFVAQLPIADAAVAVGDPSLATVLPQLGLHTLGDLAALPPEKIHARFGSTGLRAHRLACGLDVPMLAPDPVATELGWRQDYEPPLASAAQVLASCAEPLEALMKELGQSGLSCDEIRIAVGTTDGGWDERTWRHPWEFTADEIRDRISWQLAELGHQGASDELDQIAGAEPTTAVSSLRVTPTRVSAAGHHAPDLLGERPDEHVSAVMARIQHRLGPNGVQISRVGGGRLLAERRILRPWGEALPTSQEARVDQPWPGSVPGPAPARVFTRALPVGVLGEDHQSIRVDERSHLSAEPVWFISPEDPAGHLSRILAWAGPWPLQQRWWHQAGELHRFQLLIATPDVGPTGEQVWLVLTRAGDWWAEASYD
ncbi:DNA polymerase Y family protein [Parenemella sanctibonifatiensis]|uniref:UmuC domain-containing protein n=1 Tax=Parenemella sanctibonifatiensis TaxID=2016505 RepID=A0A255EMS1_9ACTN|nr:DNA polymerase Y family protein [Parenemella sanctibonifatiensis]OYN90905.1 hypothetical protein CGZ91_05315 [Parenemella sanctibonifatiensis]